MPGFKILALSLLTLLAACGAKEPENIYQAALFDDTRPASDQEQDESRKAEQILTLLDPKPGMNILDFAAGTGYYSELFSHLVGEQGKVYLHNINAFSSEKKNTAINARLERLANVKRLDTDFKKPDLPKNLDIIFLSNVFHDFYVPRKNPAKQADKDNLIRLFHTNLKPNGKLFIIDHNLPAEGFDIKTVAKLHRINPDFVINELQNYGFKLIQTSDVLHHNNDDYSKDIWNNKVRGKTDKFILVFTK